MNDPSLDMETMILGAMITWPETTLEARAKLRSSDFALSSHQTIFAAIGVVAESGQGVDLLTVSALLRQRRELDGIGGAAYLSSLGEGIPRNPAIGSYCDAVLDRSHARRASQLLTEAQSRLVEAVEPSAAVIDALVRGLSAERPSDSLTAEEVMPRALLSLMPEHCTIIPTGIPEIDALTHGGMRTKELWIIGGSPSAGKSALCRQLERSAVRNGFGVHAHSVEVEDTAWMIRHAARLAGIPVWKLRDLSSLTIEDHDRLRGAAIDISRWNYLIDDAGGVHINTLLGKSRLSVMRRDIRVHTVDYLQLLQGDERDVRLLLGNAVRRLKQFAKDNDCLVIALSQLARHEGTPLLRHLKESGDLEQAADVVILCNRPKDDQTGRFTGNDELNLAKQRNGDIEILPMRLNPQTLEYGGRYD